MRKLIAGINMTLDGFCDHAAMIADWCRNSLLYFAEVNELTYFEDRDLHNR